MVVPCYKESTRGSFSKRLFSLNAQLETVFAPHDVSVIFVFDGRDFSAESTFYEFTRSFPSYGDWSSIVRPHNRGKGYSIIEGVKALECDYVLYTDADLPVDFEVARPWIEECEQNLGVVAYLGVRGVDYVHKDGLRSLGSKIAKWSERKQFGIDCPDTQCGFKMIHRPEFLVAAKSIMSTRWLFDVELIHLLETMGCVQWEKVEYKSEDTNSTLHPIVHLPGILAEWSLLFMRYVDF